jgi:hypothetical protein
METIGLIMMACIGVAGCVAALAGAFLMIDMIFSHRITDSLRVWYERKFRTE